MTSVVLRKHPSASGKTSDAIEKASLSPHVEVDTLGAGSGAGIEGVGASVDIPGPGAGVAPADDEPGAEQPQEMAGSPTASVYIDPSPTKSPPVRDNHTS